METWISFEFMLCLLRTGCDVVVNRGAVCLSLLRGEEDSLLFSFDSEFRCVCSMAGEFWCEG